MVVDDDNDLRLPEWRSIMERPRSAAERWAVYTAKISIGRERIRTLHQWAGLVGASYTTLCESCRLLGVKPVAARDLVRALQAMFEAARYDCSPIELLDIYDKRALSTFLNKAGRQFKPARQTTDLKMFFASQQFVDTEQFGVKLLLGLLVESRRYAEGKRL